MLLIKWSLKPVKCKAMKLNERENKPTHPTQLLLEILNHVSSRYRAHGEGIKLVNDWSMVLDRS
jgi:hypothetical protein